MPSKSLLRTVFILTVIVCNISCDRISKSIIRTHVSDNSATNFLNNHLTITKVENPGAFLSIGSGLSKNTKVIALNILPILALALALTYVFDRRRNVSRLQLFAISCIIGGGIGNVFDRVVYGSVTDFLYIDFTFFHTGIFNLADVSLMLGTVLLTAGSLNSSNRISGV